VSLTAGETIVNSLLSRLDLDDGIKTGRYVKGKQPVWDQLKWDDTDTAVVDVDSIPLGLSKMSALPRYTIEERKFRPSSLVLGPDPSTGTYLFTVKGQGTGTNKAAHVVLESIYAKQYN
jgi:Tfp pilus assembly protein PilX